MNYENELKWMIARCNSYKDFVEELYTESNDIYTRSQCWEMVKMALTEQMNERRIGGNEE